MQNIRNKCQLQLDPISNNDNKYSIGNNMVNHGYILNGAANNSNNTNLNNSQMNHGYNDHHMHLHDKNNRSKSKPSTYTIFKPNETSKTSGTGKTNKPNEIIDKNKNKTVSSKQSYQKTVRAIRIDRTNNCFYHKYQCACPCCDNIFEFVYDYYNNASKFDDDVTIGENFKCKNRKCGKNIKQVKLYSP